MKPLGEQLKILRKRQGMSQAELGRHLGLAQSHISSIESGRTDPRLSTLCELAKLLGQEFMLIPYLHRSAVRALINEEDISNKRRWQPDEGDEFS